MLLRNIGRLVRITDRFGNVTVGQIVDGSVERRMLVVESKDGDWHTYRLDDSVVVERLRTTDETVLERTIRIVEGVLEMAGIPKKLYEGLREMVVVDGKLCEKERALGLYDCQTGRIVLEHADLGETLLHELGHHIHYRFFNYETVRLGRQPRRYRNNQEAFAETFVEFVLARAQGRYREALGGVNAQRFERMQAVLAPLGVAAM